MNLRDFILYKMADYKFGNANNRIGEEFTDDIIKEIEKRIDSIKKEGYSNAGWVSACNIMKEMLK